MGLENHVMFCSDTSKTKNTTKDYNFAKIVGIETSSSSVAAWPCYIGIYHTVK